MREKYLGYLYLMNTVILFSTYEVVGKTLVGRMDPFQVNFYRFLIGGLVLLFFLLIKGEWKISREELLWVGLLGIINVVFSMNLLQLSLSMVNAKASVVAVIFSSNPIFVFAFSALINKEKVNLYKIIGFIVGILGIIVIFLDKLDFKTLDYRSPLLAFFSAVLYGLYTVIGRKVSVGMGSLKMNSYSFIIGSLVLLPLLFIIKSPVTTVTPAAIPQILYLSILVTGLAYLTYFKALSTIGASKGSLVFFIKPVLASILAILFLKESATMNLLGGTMLIILGIAIVVCWPQMKKKFVK